MTVVSNDPIWWPSINSYRIASYFIVAASAGVMYDWTLTFGREVELIWRQNWSLMTGLYLSSRYLGIIYTVIGLLVYVPTISLTDAVSILHRCWSFPSNQLHYHVGFGWSMWSSEADYELDLPGHIVYVISNSIITVVNAILGVIMIARLHAMYQRRKMLVFLSVILLVVTIANVVAITIITMHMSEEELVLSGTYQCSVDLGDNTDLSYFMYWTFITAWEVLALCLAIWIAVKHFRELQRPSTGWIVRDCFTALTKSHLVYFVSFVAVSCFNFGYLSPAISAEPFSLENQIYPGLTQIFLLVQLFVLGPRLILSVREYHAKSVANSDAAIGMASGYFQERVLCQLLDTPSIPLFLVGGATSVGVDGVVQAWNVHEDVINDE
ncbi:hypothetical protein DFJ58DRAFT_740119 [Suillus subalutaceus]|uniref:uncharacterized protein n=1 Tax=Suillus subalutaceus TaxID=48586 RepID=UPI001B87DF4C|nr:uncharacterized protein DFJ58DRAFT_740119 [Suillus subalutaceus]KAG1813071.1 hypothetical protein DFJ58DRAFT_740119 [Suillus subalutaceus]